MRTANAQAAHARTVLLAGSLIALAALGCPACAQQQGSVPDGPTTVAQDAEDAPADNAENTGDTALAAEKNETVYVYAGPDGSVKSTEVAVTLANPDGEDELSDASDLTDIENSVNDNGFTGIGDSMVWTAAGEDVSYSGFTEKKVPVSVKVGCTLDGEPVEPDALAGATGRLQIRFDYRNAAKAKRTLDGAHVKLSAPFVFVTAVLLDPDKIDDVEVKGGRLVEANGRMVAIGVALPGWRRSLGSAASDIDIPDHLVIEGDATDFEMGTSLTLVTAAPLAELDVNGIDTGQLEDASAALSGAMGKLIDGSGALADGLGKLEGGARSAKAATGKLASGAKTLATGTENLADGLGTMRKSAGALPKGVGTLAGGAASLAKALDAAGSGVGALEQGAAQLEEGAASLASGSASVAAGAGALHEGLANMKTSVDALQASAQQAASELAGDTVADLEDTLDAAAEELEARTAALESAEAARDALKHIDPDGLDEDSRAALDEALELLDAAVDAQGDALPRMQEALDALDASNLSSAAGNAGAVASGLAHIAAVLGSDEDTASLAGGAAKLEAGANSVSDGAATLASGATSLHKGLSGLAGEKRGLPAAAAGAKTLSGGLGQLQAKMPALVSGVKKTASGAKKLSGGAKKLSSGLGKLDAGMGTLASGTASASQGASTLEDGLQKFGDEGVGKITALLDDTLLPLKGRLGALADLAACYDNFSGITKGTKGSVKFVIQTDAVALDGE